MQIRLTVAVVLSAICLVAGACGDSGTVTEPTPEVATSAPTATTPTTTGVPTTKARPNTAAVVTVPASAVELRAVLGTVSGPGRASELWDLLADAGRIPFVDADQVVFLYRGAGERVAWQGDFTGWEWGEPWPGTQVHGSDLWYLVVPLPPDARVLYELLVDGEPMLDPTNDTTQLSPGPKSVVAMPGFTVSDETTRRDGVASGTLLDPVLIESEAMGYAIGYQVYLPNGYEGLADLPVLYVTDGSDFSHPDMGGMPAVLDNLIDAGRIPPALAVFVDAWSPGRGENRRELEFVERPADYARFLSTELVPVIDAAYRTSPLTDARILVGTSYGGLHATATAVLQPDVFGTFVMFSPPLHYIGDPGLFEDPIRAAAYEEVAALVGEIQSCGPAAGQECPQVRVFLSSGLPELGDIGGLEQIAADFEEIGLELMFIEVAEGHGWGNWSGLMDEMLEFAL